MSDAIREGRPALGWRRAATVLLPGWIARPLRELLVARRDAKELRAFRGDPSLPAPHAAKVAAVLGAARRSGARVLIETGTFEGEMARKCRRAFREIITIELSPELARRASGRLAPYRNVRVETGDSARLLPGILAALREPAVFWLDGHYSGGETARGQRETPLLEELESISSHPTRNHVILIDDARLLGTGDYPTWDRLREMLARIHPGSVPRIEDDIVRSEPAAADPREGGRASEVDYRLDSVAESS